METQFIKIFRKISVILTLAYIIGITTLSYHASQSTGTLILGILVGLYYIAVVLKESKENPK
ncbi:hypothetical protein b3_0082 [Synechococcus phage B3]|nr:hypothetical protein b3_0082 [Synechococcus phage B3]QGT54696.1 hypothetical protein b23_0081 [Synechococcus phage B23]